MQALFASFCCLLAVRVSLGRHLVVVGIGSDVLCPLCGEDEDAFFYVLCQCNVSVMLRRGFFEASLLRSDELGDVHWLILF